MFEDRKDCECLHGDLADVGIVRDGPSRAGSHRLVLGVHGPVILDAVVGSTRAVPVVGVVIAIGPIRRKLASIGKSSLGLVMGEFNGKLATCWKSYRGAVFGGIVKTSADLVESMSVYDQQYCVGELLHFLHPPLILGELVQRIDRGIRVGVVVVRIRTALDKLVVERL